MEFSDRQVVITGCGWVTPLCAGTIEPVIQAYADRAKGGYEVFGHERVGSEVLSAYPNLPGEAGKEDAVRLAAIALEIAFLQAGLNVQSYASERKGMVLGCALAGVSGMIDFANDVREQSPRFVSPIRFPQTVGNYISGALSRAYDFRGPASTVACGSASSLEALEYACRLLNANQADIMIAGGTELIFPNIAESLTQTGKQFSDGACLFVLERREAAERRNGSVLASVPDPSTNGLMSDVAVHSTVGIDEQGAVCIDRWVGSCTGADGGTALAAAIAASKGLVVPYCGARFRGNLAASLEKADIFNGLVVRALDTAGRIHEFRAVA